MKRILTIDGGGIRGFFAIEVLKRIEQFVAKKHACGLHEYFDLVAGTSTGAIIASLVSWGYSASEIDVLYTQHAATMFTKAPLHQRHRHKFSSSQISKMLQSFFREPDGTIAKFGSKSLKTLLLVIIQNASTGSTWPLCNNPKAKFNDRSLDDCNLDLPLWQIIRASTAAPTYFEPEKLQLGKQAFHFVDGGVSAHNNPVLAAFLHATLPCYAIDWPVGADKLHIVSVGTGAFPNRNDNHTLARQNLLDSAKMTVNSLIKNVSLQQDILCRSLGRCLNGHTIDSELGDLKQCRLPLPEAFSYARYQRVFTKDDLAEYTSKAPINALDNMETIPWFKAIGRIYAKEAIHIEQLS